jgi:hypothetical protein
MIYKAKTIFTGYKLGLKTPDIYIGVPTKFWTHDLMTVNYKGENKIFKRSDIVTKQTFNDKFRPGQTYTLAYVMWTKFSPVLTCDRCSKETTDDFGDDLDRVLCEECSMEIGQIKEIADEEYA